MEGAWINKMGHPKLFYPPKALKIRVLYNIKK
jgi:hypothetical protein